MGKRKFILIASVIFVIGFGYCLYSTGKSYIPEGLPVEEIVNLPEEEFVQHAGAEEDYTEAHFYIPDEEMVNLPEEEFVQHEGAEEDHTGVRFIYIPD